MAASMATLMMMQMWSRPLLKLQMEKAWSSVWIWESQQIVEKWVNAFQESTGSKNMGVIVENPSTGEILAMDGGRPV